MEILRYAAFTSDPAGGNPAGVVLDAGTVTVTDMQRIAADIGYSETAFLVARGDPGDPGNGDFDVRYFSPQNEVPFCGHATIASAVAYADRHGPGDLVFRTAAGLIRVATTVAAESVTATLTSVEPGIGDLSGADLDQLLRALRLTPR